MLGGRVLRRAGGGGLPWGLRTTSLSTLDSNTKGRLWTFQHRGQRSGPSVASTAEMPGQAGLDSWAAGQIASLRPVSYRDSLIKQT